MTKIDVKVGQTWVESHPRFSADGPQTVEITGSHAGGMWIDWRNTRTGKSGMDRYSTFGGKTGWQLVKDGPVTVWGDGDRNLLLEAAPDLYSALFALLGQPPERCPEGCVCGWNQALDDGHAALRKARGEQ